MTIANQFHDVINATLEKLTDAVMNDQIAISDECPIIIEKNSLSDHVQKIIHFIHYRLVHFLKHDMLSKKKEKNESLQKNSFCL